MIKVLVLRILKLLKRLGYLKNIYEIVHKGQVFSLNDLYSQAHWSKRKKLKDNFSNLFLSLMNEGNIKFMKQFYLIVFYNTRHDTDNIVGMAKVFVDTMKDNFVSDDDKRHYKGLCIFPDSTLNNNTVEFLIIEKNYED
jgi:hypothetical protein